MNDMSSKTYSMDFEKALVALMTKPDFLKMVEANDPNAFADYPTLSEDEKAKLKDVVTKQKSSLMNIGMELEPIVGAGWSNVF